MLQLSDIDTSWTLFLDRDGVINHEKKNDYIRNVAEFQLYDGILEAIAKLSNFFKYIIIVTNQKGIGKGLMTHEDLATIHQKLCAEVQEAGGKIDAIYYCSDLADDSINRKPQPGMALQAVAAFPDIDLRKSLMVGNKLSDMQFGRNAGMHTAFVATTNPETPFPHEAIDVRFDHLPALAAAITQAQER
ncbi:MAG: D-glycero-alpha-D-manno-heptose-1,7-bisphosphate 7-phosphatase [Chitinophagaceae bacterium]